MQIIVWILHDVDAVVSRDEFIWTVDDLRSHFNGLVQERRNSSAIALELHLSCINPSIVSLKYYLFVYSLLTNCDENKHLMQ